MLVAIRDRPQERAADLAEASGYEKDWLKANIPKLKNMGLTVSQQVGYTLSPRGAAILNRLEKDRLNR